MKYRKKPVVVEAMQITARNIMDVAGWCYDSVVGGGHDNPAIDIQTLEGTMTANIGDFVIRGVQGEHYPCKPDIFEAMYEPVDGPGELSTLRAENARLREALTTIAVYGELHKHCDLMEIAVRAVKEVDGENLHD